jgi:hypothetical protein
MRAVSSLAACRPGAIPGRWPRQRTCAESLRPKQLSSSRQDLPQPRSFNVDDLAVPDLDSSPLADVQEAAGAAFSSDGVAATFGNDSRALHAMEHGAALADRSHAGRLRLTGAGSLRFLHGQSTADLLALSPGQGCDTVSWRHPGCPLIAHWVTAWWGRPAVSEAAAHCRLHRCLLTPRLAPSTWRLRTRKRAVSSWCCPLEQQRHSCRGSPSTFSQATRCERRLAPAARRAACPASQPASHAALQHA